MKPARMHFQAGILATAAVLCCATALAQRQNGGAMQQQQPNTQSNMQGMNGMQSANEGSPADRIFVKKALLGSMAEVQVAQIALQKSSDDHVKQFAQRMVTDHTKMIEDMKPVAQQVGVKIPDGPDKKQKAMMAKLQALSGADFDKAYVEAMVKDHKEDDADFKTEISQAQSPAVKDAATQAEPIIAGHLQVIEGIAKDMNLTESM